MDTNVKDKVEEKIITLLDATSNMPPGSKEEEVTIKEIEMLLKAVNEDDRMTNEYSYKYDQMNEDRKNKGTEKRNQIIRYCLDGAAVGVSILTLICYNKWLHEGFAYEKEGIVSSTFFRGFLNKLHPTKR